MENALTRVSNKRESDLERRVETLESRLDDLEHSLAVNFDRRPDSLWERLKRRLMA